MNKGAVQFLLFSLTCLVTVAVDGATVKVSPLQQSPAAKDEQPPVNRIIGGDNAVALDDATFKVLPLQQSIATKDEQPPVNPIIGGHNAVAVDDAPVKVSPLQQAPVAKDEQPPADRIIGGDNADPGEYPWLATLYYKGYFQCGGSILDKNTILTAAHCVINDVEQRNGKYLVSVGGYKLSEYEDSEQIRRVTTVIMNNYVRSTNNKDIAILKLAMPLNMTDSVQKIKLVSGIKQEMKYLEKGNCVAVGNGLTADDLSSYPNQVQEVSLTMASRSFCSNKLSYYRLEFTKYMICAYKPNSGTCFGDSGGPIMCYDGSNVVQIGVVSFGDQFCATGFNVFARVATLKSWVNQNMQ